MLMVAIEQMRKLRACRDCMVSRAAVGVGYIVCRSGGRDIKGCATISHL